MCWWKTFLFYSVQINFIYFVVFCSTLTHTHALLVQKRKRTRMISNISNVFFFSNICYYKPVASHDTKRIKNKEKEKMKHFVCCVCVWFFFVINIDISKPFPCYVTTNEEKIKLILWAAFFFVPFCWMWCSYVCLGYD